MNEDYVYWKKGFVEYAAEFILGCLFDVIVNAQVGGKRKGGGGGGAWLVLLKMN